jgi:hypothetical protein
MRKRTRKFALPPWYPLLSDDIQQRNTLVSFYLLYDHLDHLLDELAHAQRFARNVQAYVKLHEQRTEHAGRVTLEATITVTWIARSERIIHAARMIVDRYDLAADAPQRDRRAERLGEQARVARKLVIEDLHDRGVTPDPNLVLLTAGLREELMQLETTHLLWEIHAVAGTTGDRQLVVVAW